MGEMGGKEEGQGGGEAEWDKGEKGGEVLFVA